MFNYVNVIGMIWTFLFAARSILDIAAYHAGVRYLVNLVGTKDSVLVQFSWTTGIDGKRWSQVIDRFGRFSGQNLRCHDANLRIPFQLALGPDGEAEAKKVIVQCATQLGWAYNHQSLPRCFNYGTDVFPWKEFAPYGE